MRKLITLALADDELLFRQGLKAILQNETNFQVTIDAENGADLLSQIKDAEVKPDVVLTDLKMPELNGVEATKVLRKEYPDIKIIALTSYFNKPFVLNMISIGAVAYLAKNSTPKQMIKTIKEVYKKGFYYDDDVLRFIHENINTAKGKIVKSNLDIDYFTKRELEVLQLICKQYTAKDIAEKLFISRRTVEGHRNNLLLKTESRNIAGLVVYALKNKLVSLESDSFLD